MDNHGVCDREGCGAAGPRWPRKKKFLCRWCWHAGYKRQPPLKYRAAAETSIRMVENGSSIRAAETYFKFAVACISHGMPAPGVRDSGSAAT